jgi:large subunit ribosomal protein L29
MKENADKARGLDALEMSKQLREGAEQIFRLRFQMRMGQMDGLKKLRTLRKERARMLTVQRERELEKENPAVPAGAPEAAAGRVAAEKVAAKKPAARRAPAPQAAAKKAVTKQAPARKVGAKPAAGKKPGSAKKRVAKAKE